MKCSMFVFALSIVFVGQINAQNIGEFSSSAGAQLGAETGYKFGMGLGTKLPLLGKTTCVGPLLAGIVSPTFGLIGSTVAGLAGVSQYYPPNSIPWYPQGYRNYYLGARVGYHAIDNLLKPLGPLNFVVGHPLLEPRTASVIGDVGTIFGSLADTFYNNYGA